MMGGDDVIVKQKFNFNAEIIWRIVMITGLLMTQPACRTTGEKRVEPVSTQTAQQSFKADVEALQTVVEPILATDMSYDSQTGEIKYTLPEPALVRIRIGLSLTGMTIIHLVDWEYREAGKHMEVWDMKDATGQVEFTSRNDLLVNIKCLPVEHEKMDDFKYPASVIGFRKAPQLNISFPQVQNQTGDGVSVVQDEITIRITLSEEDNHWLMETKYEMALFVDNVFVVEDEEGTNPYNYRFDTREINDGTHVVTVNVIGYEGEIGTKSALMQVNNKGK